MIEEWKDIPDWKDLYQVSSLGRIRSLDRKVYCGHGSYRISKGRIMKLRKHKDGYMRVHLRDASLNKNKYIQVHCLVAETFIGPRPTNYQVRHKDGIRHNNVLSNLHYGTASENALDRHIHGTMLIGEDAFFTKLTAKQVIEIRNLRVCGYKLEDIASLYNITNVAVSKICLGENWKHVGGPISKRIYYRKKK